MSVTYQELMALQRHGSIVHYTDRDTMLYALSVGMGRDPTNSSELPFVFEGRGLQTIPTMATVLGDGPVHESGLDLRNILHGEQHLRLFRPIPTSGTILVDAGVGAVFDKGKERGSIVDFISRGRTEAGDPIFETTTRILARGDGAIGAPTGGPGRPDPLPARPPDLIVCESTRRDQALLYRLNKDRNPLHADPAIAQAAGFGGPILHGLCTFGIVCKTILARICDYEPSKILELGVRFTAPVIPGDTLEISIWRNSSGVELRCRAVERDVIVLDNGACRLSSTWWSTARD